MKRLREKYRRRRRRKFHIRKRIFGTSDRPRISIYRSNRYTYVQVIDDLQGVTIAAASNREKALAGIGNRVEEIGKLGEALAERMKEKNVSRAVFDRNGYLYHGIVKATADGIRKKGIEL